MTVTTSQLRSTARFTFGASAAHHVLNHSGFVELVRLGDAGTIEFVRRHRWVLESYLQGTSLSNLKNLQDALVAQVAKSGQNFTLERAGTVIVSILAADAINGGPHGQIEFSSVDSAGLLQSFTVTVEGDVPVTVTAGLIAHTFRDSSRTDPAEGGAVDQTARRGKVTTEAGTSAKTWIEANLPAPVAGFDRVTAIDIDDTDTRASYTVTDTLSDARNVDPGTVKNHIYTDTTITERSALIETSRSGTVQTEAGTNAGDWINANLPALTDGFVRNISINVEDTGLDATYTVTDTRSSGTLNWPPNITEARLDTRTTKDHSQNRRLTIKSGRFVGSDAQIEVDKVRDSLTNIIREAVTIETYGAGGINFSFTALGTIGTNELLSWREVVSKSGGGRLRRVVTQPDRVPFVFNAEQLPVSFTISGQAEGLARWVKAPGVHDAFKDKGFATGEQSVDYDRRDNDVFITRWRQEYLLDVDIADNVLPRNPKAEFLP